MYPKKKEINNNNQNKIKEDNDHLLIEKDIKKEKNNTEINEENKNTIENNIEIKRIKKIFDIYKNNNSQRNHKRSNHKIIKIKQSCENSPNSNIKRINDYTFN